MEFKDKVTKLKNTRRKERIRPFLSIIQKYWEEHPDLRFIQMLWSLKMITEDDDGINKEEKDLLKNSIIEARDRIMCAMWLSSKPVPSYIILRYMKNSDIGSIIEKHNNGEFVDDIDEFKKELIMREEFNIYI